MTQELRAGHSLTVDERTVHAAQVAEDHRLTLPLEYAMFLANDRIEQLDRVIRMASKALLRAELDHLSALFVNVDDPSHA